jgi:hypothetical protein
VIEDLKALFEVKHNKKLMFVGGKLESDILDHFQLANLKE